MKRPVFLRPVFLPQTQVCISLISLLLGRLYSSLYNVCFILSVLPLGLKETDTQAKTILKIEIPKNKKKSIFSIFLLRDQIPGRL
jgi:hypothetical protein